jgi:arylsulfatase A-like enzyme
MRNNWLSGLSLDRHPKLAPHFESIIKSVIETEYFSRLIFIFAAILFAQQTQAQTNNMPPPAPRKPSIIFIVADDLGYGELGCYGQTKIKTPNLDKLAGEGIRFTSFYAGSTVCAPSRAALMTGLHTGHGDIRDNDNSQSLGANDLTVADYLKKAGYRTGLIGKWALGDAGSTGMPHKKGFDEFVGYLNQTHAHDYYTDHLWRHQNERNGAAEFDGWTTFPENESGKKGLYIPDLFGQAAINFVRYNKSDQFNNHRPFFLYLSYTIPHANNEEGGSTGNGMQVPGDAPYSSESWPQPEKNKAAMITRMDADIGRLMDKLKELKIDDDTAVFFFSDNGPHKEGGVDPKFLNAAGPLRGIKRDLYEGGIRVPMIVRWPFQIKAGQTSDLAWADWDLLPTVCEMAYQKAPQKIDGISMLPTLFGETQTNQHEVLYWEAHEGGFKQAVRMGDWKAVRFGIDGPLELYNLKTDLGEKQNIAEKNPDVAVKIENYLKTSRTESKRWPAKTVKENEAELSKKSSTTNEPAAPALAK